MTEPQLISKLTSKSQTVVPGAVRKKLGLKPGDHIRYRISGKSVLIERINDGGAKDDPFVAFDEWATEQDETAFRDL